MIFSSSQITAFERCQRKWGYHYIDGIESPSGPGAELGTDTHGQLEGWLRNATPLDWTRKSGPIAGAIVHLIPEPKTPGMSVEEYFEIEIAGLHFRGIKDWQLLTLPPIVGDHKTCSSFDWARTAETLLEDPQATLYAADVMHRTGSNECELRWNYSRTKGAPKALPVWRTVTRDDITPRLERTVESARAMTKILESGAKAAELTPNRDACRDFGGCPYLSICPAEPGERLTAMTSVNDLISSLKAKKNGINPPPPEAPAMVPEASAVPSATPDVGALLLPGKLKTITAEVRFAEPPPPPVIDPAQAAEPPKKRGRPSKTAETIPAPEPVVPGDGSDAAALASTMLEQLASIQEQVSRLTRTAAEIVRSGA